MTIINHAVTGALIGAVIQDPVIALPAALLSHFVVDSLPHFGRLNHKTKAFSRMLRADIVLSTAFLVSLVIFKPYDWPLLLGCAILSTCPDLMWLPEFFREVKDHPPKSRNLIMRFHGIIQFEFTWGYWIELVWLVTIMAVFITVIR